MNQNLIQTKYYHLKRVGMIIIPVLGTQQLLSEEEA
jgi:hypothetical protein